jgi:hypothetical protein
MPAALALMVASIVAAALSGATAIAGSIRHVIAGAALYALVLLGGEGYASLLQRFAVTPNEQVAKRRSWNTTSPRRARPSRSIASKSASCRAKPRSRAGHRDQPRHARQRAAVGSPAAARDVRPDPGDPHLLRLRFGRQRSLRHQRQNRQVMLSARELNPAALPNRTWVNERMVFTHGHGLTLGPVNQVTSEGCPCCSSATCRR